MIFHGVVSHVAVHPSSWKSSTHGTFLLKGQATSLTVTLSIVLPSALSETVNGADLLVLHLLGPRFSILTLGRSTGSVPEVACEGSITVIGCTERADISVTAPGLQIQSEGKLQREMHAYGQTEWSALQCIL